MKSKSILLIGGLLVLQAAFAFAHAQAVPLDSLSWTWEVTTTVSTKTKTCELEFSDTLYVEWGDGTTDTLSKALSGETLTHVYSAVGDFTCLARGKSITYYKADSKRIKSLIPTKAPNLSYLSCSSNQLTELNVIRNKALVSLYCSGNDIVQLPVDSCKLIQTITCSDNAIQTLNVSGLASLKKLTCHTNPLTLLRVHPSGSLNYVSSTNCSLSTSALDTLFTQLPVLAEVSASKNLYFLNNPGVSNANVSVAIAKKWTPDYVVTSSSFYIPATSVSIGDTVQLGLCLTNPIPVIAFELNVRFPVGFKLDTLRTGISLLRKGNHVLSIASVDTLPNSYKFIAYSLKTNDLIRGNSGVVLDIFGTMPDSLQQATIGLSEAVLVDTTTNTTNVVVSDGSLTILPAFINGDANNDDMVDVTDIVNLVAYINGRNPLGFQPAAADMDKNGKFNVADITKLVVLINSMGIPLSAQLPANNRRMSAPSTYYQQQPIVVGNHLYIRTSEKPGCMELCLDNDQKVQACQVDLVLPEGLNIDETQVKPSSFRQNNHLIQLNRIDSKRYRLLMYAMKPDAAFASDSGALVVLPLVRDASIQKGEYPVLLEHAVITGMNLTTVPSKLYLGLVAMPDLSDSGESLSVWSGGGGSLFVKGGGSSQLKITDISGKICYQIQAPRIEPLQVMLAKGVYVIVATSKDGMLQRTKVLVQ